MIWVLDNKALTEENGTITMKIMVLISMVAKPIEMDGNWRGGTRKKNSWKMHFDESGELSSGASRT